jgi:hypothetical protein
MTEQLHLIATLWAGLSGQSLATLGSKQQGDSRFFARIASDGSCTTRSFEKFLTFFRDAANWPDNVIPQAAADLLDNFENIASAANAEVAQCHGGDAVASHSDVDSGDGASASTGYLGEMSREVVA